MRPHLVLVLALLAGGGASAQDATPAGQLPPPMYLPEPAESGGLAGFPGASVADMLPDWPRWFAGASGLVMTRTLPTGAATMQPLAGVQLTTSDTGASWPGGVDLHVGRWFGPRQQQAIELVYWGVFGIGGTASVASPADAIVAIPQATGVTVGGTPADQYLTGASLQQVSRSDIVNDIEINWVYSLWDRPEFLPRERAVNLMWLAGFRFFEVYDSLQLTTTPGSSALAPLALSLDTNNNIYGAQVGAKFDWRFLPRVRFTAVPKFMIGGNAITNTTTLASGGTTAAFAGGQPVDVPASLGVFSWLGSVDTGVAWDVTPHWSLWMGYRVVGVGNIAQADGQWPADISSPAAVSAISAGSSTIVHGGFAGFEGRY